MVKRDKLSDTPSGVYVFEEDVLGASSLGEGKRKVSAQDYRIKD